MLVSVGEQMVFSAGKIAEDTLDSFPMDFAGVVKKLR